MGKRGNAADGSDLRPAPRTWLNRYRREAEVSQEDLAAATGISESTLYRMESGQMPNTPIGYLVNCAYALGLDDWQLLLEDETTEWHDFRGDKAGPRRAKRSPEMERPATRARRSRA